MRIAIDVGGDEWEERSLESFCSKNRSPVGYVLGFVG